MTTTLTPSDIMDLSDEELRVEVAKVDGWTNICRDVWDASACNYFWEGIRAGGGILVPDYPNDLNAIAPVEQKVLEKVGELVYHDALVQMRLRTLGKSLADATCAELATVAWADARKRCIACLLALKEEG